MRQIAALLVVLLLSSLSAVHASHFATFGGGAQPMSRRASNGKNIRKVTLTSSSGGKPDGPKRASGPSNLFMKRKNRNLEELKDQLITSGDDSLFFYPAEAPPLTFVSQDEMRKRSEAQIRRKLDKMSADENYDEYEDEDEDDFTSESIISYVRDDEEDKVDLLDLKMKADIYERGRRGLVEMCDIPMGSRKMRLIPWRLATGTLSTGLGFFYVGFFLGGVRGLPWLLFRKVLGVDAPFIPETIGRLKRWSGKGARWGLEWAKVGAPMAAPALIVKWARGVPYLDEVSLPVGMAAGGFMLGRYSRWQPYATIICPLILGYMGLVQGPLEKQSYLLHKFEGEEYYIRKAELDKKQLLMKVDDDEEEEEIVVPAGTVATEEPVAATAPASDDDEYD
eukprot:CAMPEP_0194061970 /NCGR_PEP_ID=MMETSP0009_2-20130614/76114_1 /TAXON_ID=210454 /ORGANISM="Grammatophora oceanica, Strain CCMP 410" /LENGTH=393 /DNA_ID=CAMNT_0038713503 /DNA_START=21 /DNA_END=1202 /DNA_ORIENTATION=+